MSINFCCRKRVIKLFVNQSFKLQSQFHGLIPKKLAGNLSLSFLTFSEKTLHVRTCLVVVNKDVKAQVLEALEQLACVFVRAVTYIHTCGGAGGSDYKDICCFLLLFFFQVKNDLITCGADASLPVLASKFLLLIMMHFPTCRWLILYWNVGETIL